MSDQLVFDLQPPEPTSQRKYVFGGDDQVSAQDGTTSVTSYLQDAGGWARDTGIHASVEADQDGFEEGLGLIAACPRGTILSATVVRSGQNIGSPRILGAVFRVAAKQGLIEPEGFSTSFAASRHGGLERTWRRT